MSQDALEKLARKVKRQAKNFWLISQRASKTDSDYYFGVAEGLNKAHSMLCDAIKERDENCRKYEVEKLRNLPPKLQDVIEEIRIDVVTNRACKWMFISQEAHLELIDYLRGFVLRRKNDDD